MKNPLNIINLQSPYHFYKEARKKHPIFFDPISKYWVVSTYEAVEKIMKDENHFSARLDRVNYSDLLPESRATLCPINFEKLYGLSTTENPSHDKVKRVLMPVWNRLFADSLKPQIQEIVDSYISGFKKNTPIDILKEFFNPLPAQLVFTILGIDKKDIPKVKEWSMSRLHLTWGDKSKQIDHAHNIVQYWQYCVNMINDKMTNPGNDLPSLLLQSHREGKITLHEIQLLCYGLVFSGHTTTSAFLAEALKVLIQTGLWAEHRDNKIPFSQSVDELLRLCPSAFTRRRITIADKLIGGHQFRKGDEILLVIGSANRDETVFPDPDKAIINRKNAKLNLTLGRGFHYCIGAKLVKTEYTIVMQSLMKAFPNMRLSPDGTFNYPDNISIRALDRLDVILS